MDYNIFVQKWIERSERQVNIDQIDIGDQFISLWIAFNAWLKNQYGADKSDRFLINKVSENIELEEAFIRLRDLDNSFQGLLPELGIYRIIDMRYPDNESKRISYDGSYKSLINALYMIRCNLFHGRKNIDDDNTDIELVTLAYKILLPLFKKHIQPN